MSKRILSFILCAAIVLSMSINAFASDIFGYAHIERRDPIGQGTTLVQNHFYNGTQRQSEKYVNYTPNTAVYPMVYYGTKLYGRSSINTVTKNLEAQGYRVHAAINADFFSYSTGLPLGMLINNGVINSSCTTENAIAFFADGSAFIGTPGFSTTMQVGEKTYTINHVNKLRQPYGVYLITECFSSSTRTSSPGYDVVLRPAEGSVYRLGQTVFAEVVDMFPSEAAIAIPEGCWILTVDDKADAVYRDVLTSLALGDTVEITSTVSDERFLDAVYAVGGGDIILDNGAVVSNSDTANAPRTALGIKADGTVVLYAIDGRQSSLSVGASVNKVASRLKELGCVYAINLDGGGSTAISVTPAAKDKASILNSPSDGTPRTCANYILLVSSEKGSGSPYGIDISFSDDIILLGSTVTLSAEGYDETFAKASIGDVTYSSDFGKINGNKFTPTQSGTVTVTASDGVVSGTKQMTVISTPYTISAKANGAAVSSLTVRGGSKTTIEGVASGGLYKYYYDQGVFTFSDNVVDGVYTAPEDASNDTITISCGSLTINLPVTITELADPDVTLSATATDAKIEIDGAYERVYLTIDGKDTALSGGESIYTASYRLSEGQHKISAYVVGKSGYTVKKTVAVGETVTHFEDTKGHWSDSFASYLYDVGAANGELTSEGTRLFYPDKGISRQEFAKMTVSVLGADLTQYENVDLPYSDISDIDKWALPYVRACYSLGVMSGSVALDGTTVFNPSGNVSRAEVIAIIGRTLDSNYRNGVTDFPDVRDLPSWASPYLGALTGLGIISGYSDGTLKPTQGITRAEAAKMLAALF